jgi:hypothetical protein
MKVYVATPAGEYDKTKAVIYSTDALGFAVDNNFVHLSTMPFALHLTPAQPSCL